MACVYKEGVLIVEDIQDFLLQKDIEEQTQYDLYIEETRKKKGQPLIQCYSTCRKTGHNVRTYQNTIVVLGLSDFE